MAQPHSLLTTFMFPLFCLLPTSWFLLVIFWSFYLLDAPPDSLHTNPTHSPCHQLHSSLIAVSFTFLPLPLTCPASSPTIVRQAEMSEAVDAPREAWCARHLTSLCRHALRAYDAFSVYNNTRAGRSTTSRASTSGLRTVSTTHPQSQQLQPYQSQRQRGFFVNYASLPGAVSGQLLPAFGVAPSADWLSRMDTVSRQYSKSRGGDKGKGKGGVKGAGQGEGKDEVKSEGVGEGKAGGSSSGVDGGALPLPGSQVFVSDSQDKDDRAPPMLKQFATMLMQPTYEEMERVSERCWGQWRDEQAGGRVGVEAAAG